MNVTITARHCTPPERVRQLAEETLERLVRYEDRLVSAAVSFELDHGLHKVEARLSVAGGPTTLAHGSGESFREALDRMSDRLRRQLQSRRERRRDHRAERLSEILSPAGGP